MMHQVNLIPDSKQLRLHQRRIRELATTVAMLVMASAVGVPLLLLGIKGSQALYLRRVQSQIDQRQSTIQQTADIDTILTVKDHLNSLTGLYQQRVYATALLAYLPKVVPKSVHFSSVTIDTAGTISFVGTSTSYGDVDKFYQALRQAGISTGANKVQATIGNFSDVVLKSVSGPSGKEVTFAIDAGFDTKLVNGAQ